MCAGAAAGALAAGCGGLVQGGTKPGGRCTGSLEFFSNWPPDSLLGQGVVQAAQDFTAAHPGCKVEPVYVAGGNPALLEKLVTTVAGGTQPPVALVPGAQNGLWISNGVLQPLTTWAKRDRVTNDLFVPGYWPQMEVRGQLWRLPFQIDADFPWFWNKATFRAAGLNPDKGPVTIDELEQMAPKLTRRAAGASSAGLELLPFVPWLLYGEVNSL